MRLVFTVFRAIKVRQDGADMNKRTNEQTTIWTNMNVLIKRGPRIQLALICEASRWYMSYV